MHRATVSRSALELFSEAMRRVYGTSSTAQYRSAVSDVFDGRLVSTVRCGTCHSVSRTIETFQVSALARSSLLRAQFIDICCAHSQDLSIAIPTAEQMAQLAEYNKRRSEYSRSNSSGGSSEAEIFCDAHERTSLSASSSSNELADLLTNKPSLSPLPTMAAKSRASPSLSSTLSLRSLAAYVGGWLSWSLSPLAGLLAGGDVALDDCLRAFFLPDELRGDNMYNCERCNK